MSRVGNLNVPANKLRAHHTLQLQKIEQFQLNMIEAEKNFDSKLSSLNSNSSSDSQSEDDEEQLVCVDPEDKVVYKVDLSKGMQILEQSKLLCEKYLENAKIHYKQIRDILDYPEFIWDYSFSEEAVQYRRRPVPLYLLQNESSKYPCYIYQSELSKAFTDQVKIRIVIDLMNYRGKKEIINPIIKLEESLVASLNEVIKDLLRQIYTQSSIQLHPAANHEFVLKADGYRDYLRGNYSLLSYERVRQALKNTKPLKLILTEVNINELYSNENFPPSIKPYKKHINKKSAEKKADINPYNNLLKISPFFWYPSLKFQQDDDNNSPSSTSPTKRSYTVIQRVTKKPISHNGIIKIPEPKKILCFTDIELMRNLDPLTKGAYEFALYSGECNIPFRLRLIGMERIFRLFDELNERIATMNGKAEATNQTFTNAGCKVIEVESRVKLPAVMRDLLNKINAETLPLSSPFTNYLSCNHVFADFKKKKLLSFQPFALYCELAIYHGCQIISQMKCSSKFSFANAIKMNEWIVFPELHYCQIPKNAKLCINILAQYEHKSIIIGSVTMPLFNAKGKLHNERTHLHIWPFYKYDERLGCMNQYNWVKESQSSEANSAKVDSFFSKISLEFDSFILPMYWKPIDTRQIQTKGFSKNYIDTEDQQLLDAKPLNSDLASLKHLLTKDPLQEFTSEEKMILIKSR